MLKTLNCISLYSAVPTVQKIDFDRDLVVDDEAEVTMAIKTDMTVDDAKKPKKVKLNFSVSAQSKRKDDCVMFGALLEIEYFFHIIDLEAFSSLSDEEQLNLCTNLTYLDFRSRLLMVLMGVGMRGIKLPLSFQKFKGDLK